MDSLFSWLQPFMGTAFAIGAAPVTWLEVVAFVLSVTMVVCNIRVNPLGWPLAIVSSLLYFAVFWRSRLYGDASLQIFFALIAGWGWWQWLRGSAGDGQPLVVRRLDTRTRWVVLFAMAVGWPATGLFLKSFTDTDVPWWDAFPTAGSVIGQILLGRKYIENWPAWVVVNGVGLVLFASKGLWLTAVLYAVFFLMSFAGWRVWRRLLPTPNAPAA